MTSRLVVITGGSGSGKTSLVAYLGSLGYPTVSEAAIEVIEDLNQRLGVPGQLRWREEHPLEFQRLVTKRQMLLEDACLVPAGTVAFCDRGRPDALAYARLYGFELDAEIQTLVKSQRYIAVFLLSTLSRFVERPATGRSSNYERSVRVHDLLKDAYCEMGYTPVMVPELPILERGEVVLAALGRLEPGSAEAHHPTSGSS